RRQPFKSRLAPTSCRAWRLPSRSLPRGYRHRIGPYGTAGAGAGGAPWPSAFTSRTAHSAPETTDHPSPGDGRYRLRDQCCDALKINVRAIISTVGPSRERVAGAVEDKPDVI